MTNITPKQMREMADALDAGVFRSEGIWPEDAQDVENAMAVLRTAADQLEAVHSWAETSDREPRWDDLDAILKPVADAS